MRATLQDIAREAGVSSATVDRVINSRPGVAARTRGLVLEAAQRLGYFAGNTVSTIPLEFLLPAGTNQFMHTLADQLQAQAAIRPDLTVAVRRLESFNPESLAGALRALAPDVAGVGLVALDHPTVREAVREVARRGIQVATLVSDVHHVPRVAYVGIDNRAAGRLAGYLLGRFMRGSPTGKVALFAGSLSYRGHEEREMGFRHVLAEDFPGLEIVELRETRDDARRAFTEAMALLKRHADLAGIYNIGAGNDGIAEALATTGRSGKVVFIAHELTAENRRFLLDGILDAVIDQNPRVEAREALNILRAAVRGESHDPHLPRLQVIFRENIPD